MPTLNCEESRFCYLTDVFSTPNATLKCVISEEITAYHGQIEGRKRGPLDHPKP
jgi:hypothetical protein